MLRSTRIHHAHITFSANQFARISHDEDHTVFGRKRQSEEAITLADVTRSGDVIITIYVHAKFHRRSCDQ